ncbi:Staphylococcal virulence regulator protein A [Aeromonas hydrophila]|nr:Staphylococcal virulence regulator protein A [Aeromonas hydrophila]
MDRPSPGQETGLCCQQPELRQMYRDQPVTRPNPLLTAPMTSVLLRMTGPMILGIVAILAFNLVDTFFIGMLGTQALAAISFTFPVTFVVTSLAMGLGAGLSAVMGHALGQGKHEEAARITTDNLFLAVLLVTLIAVAGALTIHPLFRLLGASDALIALIYDYMLIWYLTVPMLVLPMVGNAAIRATGDTKTPSLVMTVAGLVNGVLDPLLIFGIGPFPEWGIRGAAIATSLSWLMAMLVSLYILRHREGLLRWRLSPRPQLLAHWRALLHVAVPASFTNMLNPLANAVLMTIFAGLGTEVVAAYGAASRVEALLLIVMMALSSVLAPFISQNCGAGNPARAKAALQLCMRFALLFQLAVYALTWLLAPFIADLFSDHPQVVRLIVLYLHLVPIGYGFQGMVMLLASALNGVRASSISFLFNGVRLFVFLLPGAWLGAKLGGEQGIYLGILLANLAAGTLAWWYGRHRFEQLCHQGKP